MKALVRFALIGALLFTGERWLARWAATSAAARPRIVVSAEEIALLRQEALARGAGATPEEMRELIAAAVDDEILYREALALGLNEGDAVIERRLKQNAAFLGTDVSSLDEGDPVVRRRLVQAMRFHLEQAAALDEPTEVELRGAFSERAEQFSLPERVRLTHLFLSRERRGARLQHDAEELLVRLQNDGSLHVTQLSDPLPIPSELSLQSVADVEKLLGAEIAAAVRTAPIGVWRGPFASPYGLHLVRVQERRPPEPASFDLAREQLRLAWKEDRAAAAVREALVSLRAGYEVVVEPTS